MSRFAWLPLVAIIAACAGVPDDRQQRYATAVAMLDQARESGQITATQHSQHMRKVSDALFGPHPVLREYWAYHAYIASEVDAGRITRLQAEALTQQKLGEIQARERSLQAQQLRALAPYVQPTPAQKPAQQPAPIIFAPSTLPAPNPSITCRSRRDPMGTVITDCN